MLLDYKEILEKGLVSNDKSIMACYERGNAIIASLQKELDKDDLAFDQRKYIIDQMMQVSKMIHEKDSENKKFIAVLSMIAGTVVAAGIGALASTLGSNSHIDTSDNENT